MGGDSGPRLCVSAALKFARSNPSVRLTLVGDHHLLNVGASALPQQITILPADESVHMSERPASALRHKRDSSMALAVRMVADGEADACVSGGNTGALMAFGLHLIGTMPGIERPAICKALPSRGGVCRVLDLGANLECTAEHLRQFACMGAALARLGGTDAPRVALLNVGVENLKGRELEQEAASLLMAQDGLNFIGFVEGSDIYRDVADVVVCDGFTGNVLLKASEGAAEFLQSTLKSAFQSSAAARIAGWFAWPVLSAWSERYNPARLNGATFLGLNGVVVKSHGGASEEGFIAALNVAHEQATHQIIAAIATAVAV
jgi:glycerol-3-phosphate acyltransferase PlsX